MLTIEQIKEALTDRRIPIVSEATGVHHNTIAAIRDGKTSDPSFRVVKALSDYFAKDRVA